MNQQTKEDYCQACDCWAEVTIVTVPLPVPWLQNIPANVQMRLCESCAWFAHRA